MKNQLLFLGGLVLLSAENFGMQQASQMSQQEQEMEWMVLIEQGQQLFVAGEQLLLQNNIGEAIDTFGDAGVRFTQVVNESELGTAINALAVDWNDQVCYALNKLSEMQDFQEGYC